MINLQHFKLNFYFFYKINVIFMLEKIVNYTFKLHTVPFILHISTIDIKILVFVTF